MASESVQERCYFMFKAQRKVSKYVGVPTMVRNRCVQAVKRVVGRQCAVRDRQRRANHART